MAKPKRNDFNKYLAELDEAALRAELSKLFDKLPQVQEFYAQELMSESERKAMLEAYKKKVDNQFWRGNRPQNPSDEVLDRILMDFENISVVPQELIDLMLYRVEAAIDGAAQVGGEMRGKHYQPTSATFAEAVSLMHAHALMEHFRARCEALFQKKGVDFRIVEGLEEVYYNGS